MPNLSAKIKSLEKKVQKFKSDRKPDIKPVPKRWEDFVRLTTIRSGGRMVRFEPWRFQSLLVGLMERFNNIVVVKSRQTACSQTIFSKFLHDSSLSEASSSVAFMRNEGDAASASRRIKQMLKGLNSLGISAQNDNVGYIKLKNLGDIYIKNSGKEGTRSLDSVTNFLFDEAAFVANIEQIYAASSPSGALAGDNITKLIVSTPSAKNGWYWERLSENNQEDIEEICQRVANGELYKDDLPGWYWFVDNAGVCKVIIHFLCHPVFRKIHESYPGGYLAYRQKQDGTDRATIEREYNLLFADHSVSIFDPLLVALAKDDNLDYEEIPDPNCNYYAGIDVSAMGEDHTVGIILKEEKLSNLINLTDEYKYSVAAIYRKKKQTSDYNIYHLAELIKKYKPYLKGIYIEKQYGIIYYEQLYKLYPSLEFSCIHTNENNKQHLISNLQLLLEKQLLSIPSNCPLIDELLSFRRQGKQLGAVSGKNDDCVLAASFALFLTHFNKGDELANIDPEAIEVIDFDNLE